MIRFPFFIPTQETFYRALGEHRLESPGNAQRQSPDDAPHHPAKHPPPQGRHRPFCPLQQPREQLARRLPPAGDWRHTLARGAWTTVKEQMAGAYARELLVDDAIRYLFSGYCLASLHKSFERQASSFPVQVRVRLRGARILASFSEPRPVGEGGS